MAEKYPAWSPYNYVMNNPLGAIDPDGRDAEFIRESTEWFWGGTGVKLGTVEEQFAREECCPDDGPAARQIEQDNKRLIEGKVTREQLLKEWEGRIPMADAMVRLFFEPYDWMRSTYELYKGQMTWKEFVLAAAPLLSGTTIHGGNHVLSWLLQHEARGGHVIARHVGKTDTDLISRLASNRRITGASSFYMLKQS